MKGSIYLEEMSSSMTLGVELLQVAHQKLAVPFWSGLKKNGGGLKGFVLLAGHIWTIRKDKEVLYFSHFTKK